MRFRSNGIYTTILEIGLIKVNKDLNYACLSVGHQLGIGAAEARQHHQFMRKGIDIAFFVLGNWLMFNAENLD